MGFEEVFNQLNQNPEEVSLETVRILIQILGTLIDYPQNGKFRTLEKSNEIISKKILDVKGGLLCLQLIGYREVKKDEPVLVLPADVPLNKLIEARHALITWRKSTNTAKNLQSKALRAKNPFEAFPDNKNKASSKHVPEAHRVRNSSQELIRPIVLPPLTPIFSDNHFIYHIELQFHSCLRYADKHILERARNLLPIHALSNAASQRLRNMQEYAKRNKLDEPNLAVQDMLILELLRWFKNDFFTWINSPDCEVCGGSTQFSHMSNDKSLWVFTNRVEAHKCEPCQRFTMFARYDDLNILLETRKGRCGEWANTFTLFCRALGWDARYVLDENDHVWTEVYSDAQRRWLHCDPCENICDKPLIYESGWNKKITYVMAFSNEEVQDVTWRYSSNHKLVLSRRKKCDESILINALMTLRAHRQKSFSQSRVAYLTKRLALELVEMLTEKKPGDGENEGRLSGDMLWRISRGEFQERDSTRSYTWRIGVEDNQSVAFVRYSCTKDVYELAVDGEMKSLTKKWQHGCLGYKNVSRKEETDWKYVYLARADNNGDGVISWQFELICGKKQLDTIVVRFDHAVFENGVVKANIFSDDICQEIPGGSHVLRTNRFAGKTKLIIQAVLTGGTGSSAWQHSQLFRQSMESSHYPFSIDFSFR